MNNSSPINTTASSLPARKITRKELAAYCGLSVRRIDQLTSTGVLGHYKIGGSVRYDLAEVEATLRERFHVQPTAQAPQQQQQQHSGFVIPHSGFVIPSAATIPQPHA